ncbi:MAG: polysaccharide deacetylase family protein [Anaerolineales bacterium]|nr:polysaccharide deacetylase family protein [Anaerolineales bacterium]
MSTTPRVLLSIDYEPWFALFRRYDSITDPTQRRNLDDGFTLHALNPILEQLGDAKASIYLVGEVGEWYPEVPQRIVSAGHELGLHCHVHRSLKNMDELVQDVKASSAWRKQYNVRGYRAPMIGISEAAYPMLAENGFVYSSSIYAPAGVFLQKANVWEIPVSTVRLFGKNEDYTAPRDFKFKLLFSGEFPYGSSFSIGLMEKQVLKLIERDLKHGLSPSLFLHPYELASIPASARITRDLILHPQLLPFLRNKSGFLKTILRNFPVSPLGTYLDETLSSRGVSNA